MYKIEETEKSLIILEEFIKKEFNKKEQELLEINKKIGQNKFIQEIKNNFSVEFIINNKDKLLKLIPELTNDINIIEFFYNNNATNIEQVSICLNHIKEHEFFSNTQNNELIIRKEEIEKQIYTYKTIINNEEYSLEDYIEVIETSPLSENEKLSIYASIAYKSLKFKEKEQVNETENKENLLKREEITHKTYNQYIEEYKMLKEQIQEFINKYYNLIDGKTPKYISYIKSYVNISKSEETEESIYDYPEEKLLITLFGLIEIKEEIEKELNTLNENSLIDELEVLDFNIEMVNEELKKLKELSEKYEEYIKQEKLNVQANKIYYLIEDNKLMFNLKDNELEDNQRVPTLIDKLNRGIFDYQKGQRHSRVQTTYKENVVFVNKNSNMACSFIRIDDEKILILNIAPIKTIYDTTQTILNQKSDLIRKTINNILVSNEDELKKQEFIINELNSMLKTGGVPRL